jgi:hypothetical protein
MKLISRFGNVETGLRLRRKTGRNAVLSPSETPWHGDRSSCQGRKQTLGPPYYLVSVEGAGAAGDELGAALVSVFEFSDPGGVVVVDAVAGGVLASLLVDVSGTGDAGEFPAPGAGVGAAGALAAADVSVDAGAAGAAGAEAVSVEFEGAALALDVSSLL